MKAVYEAAHAVEAHMIADVLRQENIRGLVQGEYLQGAIGGLPAAGLVRVMVDEVDYDLARRAIERWNAQQPGDDVAPASSTRSAAAAWPWFAAGLLVGAFATLASGLAQGIAGAPQAEVPLCRP